jgi:hypothetical protein
MINGSCLCGATAFEIEGDLAPGTLCHCGQCRRQTSQVYASTHIPEVNLKMTKQAELRWFSASPSARRGFCGACGSVLFWNPSDEGRISVSLGALDEPHPGRLAKHIFTDHKGAYYEIDTILPQSGES